MLQVPPDVSHLTAKVADVATAAIAGVAFENAVAPLAMHETGQLAVSLAVAAAGFLAGRQAAVNFMLLAASVLGSKALVQAVTLRLRRK